MGLNDLSGINIKAVANQRLKRLLLTKLSSVHLERGSLGFLEELAFSIGLILNSVNPRLRNPTLLIFAGDHGISRVLDGSRQPTYEVLQNFLDGGAPVNIFCRQNGLELKIVDVGVDHSFEGSLSYWLNHGTKFISKKTALGTQNFLEFPAMTTAQVRKALKTGIKQVDKERKTGCNLIGFGDIGNGNSLSALTIASIMLDIAAENLFEKEDLDDSIQVLLINKALRVHPKTFDPLTVLTLYGGFEIAAICGALLCAARHRMLILIDGLVCTAALLLAYKMKPEVLDYCIFTQNSGNPAHKKMLQYFNAKPILDFKMTLGEGNGVALAFPIVQNAASLLNNRINEK